MSVEERLKQIIERTTKMPCIFGDENDRQGYYYEVRDTDFHYLLKVIEGRGKIIDSSARIMDAMEDDYSKLNKKMMLKISGRNLAD